MNHLIAKTKGTRGKFLKVMSDKNIFDYPDTLGNAVGYDCSVPLEDDEWYQIKNFREKEYCIDFLKKKFISADYTQIKESEYFDIEYLISYQQGNYFFQKLANRQILGKKFFTINQEPEFYNDKRIIIIESLPHAVYISAEDTIYFKSLTYIHQLFKGIEILYKEATKQETEDFLGNSFICLKNNFDADKVKQSNRKRIALAIEALDRIPVGAHKQLFQYIFEYRPDLKYDGDKGTFEISNEQELKELLYGLTERYYTTSYGHEKRLAKSVISI